MCRSSWAKAGRRRRVRSSPGSDCARGGLGDQVEQEVEVKSAGPFWAPAWSLPASQGRRRPCAPLGRKLREEEEAEEVGPHL